MLYWAVVLFVVGVIASLLGFGGLAGAAFGVAKGLIILKVVGVILVLGAVGFAIAHARSGGAPRLR